MFLDVETLALPPPQLEKIIEQRGEEVFEVDEIAGLSIYNTNKNCYILREEILELFLGTPESIDKEHLEAAVASIARRSREDWQAKSPRVHYDPSIWTSDKSPDECYTLNIIFLEHLYNDWLLQRVVVQRLHGDSSELLRLSSELLSHGLAVVTLAGGDISWVIADLPWSIMLFCLPPAGVLVLELLRQAQSRSSSTAAFSRSSVIQNLSVLISTLEWIARPGIGNYELCRQARSMLQRSLDRILDPSLMARGDRQHPSSESDGHTGSSTLVGNGVASNDPISESDSLLQWSPEQWLSPDADMAFWNNLEDHSLLMFNSDDTFWPKAQGLRV